MDRVLEALDNQIAELQKAAAACDVSTRGVFTAGIAKLMVKPLQEIRDIVIAEKEKQS
jgi:hypothetical protein